MNGDWIDLFPALSDLDKVSRQTLNEGSQKVEVGEGAEIFKPGEHAQNMLLLTKGTVRVQQISENGREIVLYRVNAGESCVLTTACLLAYQDYSASGIAETDVRAVAIAKGTFDQLMAASPQFRQFVFAAVSTRITDLFLVIEEVAFRRVDTRLAEKLLALDTGSGVLSLTHQTLATELGTAREVVSRQLQEFQRRGLVSATRGEIRLTDVAGLRAFTRMQVGKK